MNDAETLLKLIQGKSSVRIEPAYYRAIDGTRVIVDIGGGGRVPADVATSYRPEINEVVHVLFIDGRPYLLGPAIPKPGEGVVKTAPSGGMVTVVTDIGDVACTYPNGESLSSGQKVKLYWSSGAHVISVMSTTPAPPPDPGGGTGAPGLRSAVFTAIQAGSWQPNGSRWIDEPRASNGYIGAWHYGTKTADTIPASATNGTVEMFIRYTRRFGNPPIFSTHAQATRGGAPSLSNDNAWAPVDGWNRMPPGMEAVFFNSLKAGGGALGVGLNHGGQNSFASLGADPQSGALRISWYS